MPAPVLPSPHAHPLFDVEQFRALDERHAVVQVLNRPAVVLGSTQPAGIVSSRRARAAGTEVVRRRGGGGAVLLRPGDHLWIDAWVPRHDPLWNADIAVASAWVGAWWGAALGGFGVGDLTVHRGRADPGRHGRLVCFSGRGPGELFLGERKVMGISQWRSRQGSLFHTCAYMRWEPGPLVELLDVDPSMREGLINDLTGSAIGVHDLKRAPGLDDLRDSLLTSFPAWERDVPLRRA